MAEIVALLIASRHRWDGRPDPDLVAPPGAELDLVDRIELRAGLGIVGDRYFNQTAHRGAAVTIMSAEALDGYRVGLAAARRNILLRGVDVDAATDRTLRLDSGDGPVLLRLRRRANPCRWLDLAVAPGAWRALR